MTPSAAFKRPDSTLSGWSSPHHRGDTIKNAGNAAERLAGSRKRATPDRSGHPGLTTHLPASPEPSFKTPASKSKIRDVQQDGDHPKAQMHVTPALCAHAKPQFSLLLTGLRPRTRRPSAHVPPPPPGLDLARRSPGKKTVTVVSLPSLREIFDRPNTPWTS